MSGADHYRSRAVASSPRTHPAARRGRRAWVECWAGGEAQLGHDGRAFRPPEELRRDLVDAGDDGEALIPVNQEAEDALVAEQFMDVIEVTPASRIAGALMSRRSATTS